MEHMAQKKFALAVIGGGPAGYEAAAFAASHGLNTVLIEKNNLGGTCLNCGCIPTKTLLHTVDIYHEVTTQAAQIGLNYTDFNYDMTKMQQRKDEVITSLQSAVAKLMQAHKITVLKGTAKITGPDIISIENCPEASSIQADKILIASGSVPAMPPIEGIEHTLSSTDLLNETKVFDHLVIIGGGVIGIEFASLYTSLGKKVTVIEALDRLLANMDKEFGQSIKMLLKKRGADIKTKTAVTKIEKIDGKIICHFSEKNKFDSVRADAVLTAVGRRPFTQDLWADDVAIESDRGKIKINEHYQTSLPNIYAAGDAAGGIQLAHAATAQAINAVCHMLQLPPKYDMHFVPGCIYTNPEIASVGMTADEAKKLGRKILTLKYPMSANGKSLLSLQERGFVKLIADAETKQLLGAQLMCARATDMISQFTQALVNKLTLDDLSSVIYPHPTFNEAFGKIME